MQHVRIEYGDTDAGSLQQVKRIYLSSFPRDERRSFTTLRRYLTSSRRRFYITTIKVDGIAQGFLTYWDLGKFLYIEHFAVSEELRGKRLGTKLLGDFLGRAQKTVILEVEPPTTPNAARRIDFYKRMGFCLHLNHTYIQPPYGNDREAIELKLMSYGSAPLSENDLHFITASLYEQVYNVKPNVSNS